MEIVGWIALGVSVVSAVIAGKALRTSARGVEQQVRANELQIRAAENLKQSVARGSRLQAYTASRDFLDYCGKYLASYNGRVTEGTRALWKHIDTYKVTINNLGLLEITGFKEKAERFRTKGALLARLLDQLASVKKDPRLTEETRLPAECAAEDRVHEVIDWFHKELSELEEYFAPYLTFTKDAHEITEHDLRADPSVVVK